MNKNYMSEIAKLLGVNIGEEFIIQNADRKETVVLAMNGFLVIQPSGLGIVNDQLLPKVLQGHYEIIKLPWEPKNCDDYYVLNVTTGRIECYSWGATTFDLAVKSLGIIYRTKAEAEANMSKDCERLTGKPLSSR